MLVFALLPSTALAQVDSAVLEAEASRVAVVEKCVSSTVAVFSRGGQGGGSGVVISPDGYALSNFHVTSACGNWMQCGMADGRLYDAVIVGLDPTGDVALIKLLGRDDFPHAELGDSDRVRVGDWCFTVGNPFLLATDFHPSVAFGVISGVHRYQYPAGTILEYADCLQADAAINPGNSGGPMFDATGRLIGINGRGSFEKRGRVNVGVGYAISINQIKNFLGHLKSGRLVDHATLGARMASDVERKVLVDDILEESDAYRRGLRYGDQLLSFAGRATPTVNAFKNALGIYPQGWRVPLTFARGTERIDVLVRLRGVHSRAQLEEMAQAKPKAERPMPRRPGDPAPKPGDKPRDPENPPGPRMIGAKPPAMPAVVKQHFIARPGYVNYYFNQLNRDRVWKAFLARGDYAAWKSAWTLAGTTSDAEDFRFELSDREASIKLPSGELKIDVTTRLANKLDPPGTGGLLVALSLWRRMLLLGPEKFGEAYYLGTVPLPGREGLFDVLSASHDGIECHFMFDPADGQLAALEMYPVEDVDPCELYFADYQEHEGHQVPMRIEARHGDEFEYVFTCKSYAIAEVPAAEAKPEVSSDETSKE